MTDSRIDGMPETKFSTPFREMAERIERNPEAEFAGAIVVVPPEGDPITIMLNDPKPDLEAFWGVAAGKIQVATQEFQQKHGQNQAGFGNRR